MQQTPDIDIDDLDLSDLDCEPLPSQSSSQTFPTKAVTDGLASSFCESSSRVTPPPTRAYSPYR